MSLEIQNLHVRTEEREILRGVDLAPRYAERHAFQDLAPLDAHPQVLDLEISQLPSSQQ